MEIAVSAMTVHDLDAVLALWGQTSGVGLNESDTPDQLRAYLDRNPGLSLIARDGTRLVAAVLCGHDGRRGYLNHLAVVPEYRGRGLGRQMVGGILCNPVLAGIPPFEAAVDEQAWIAAGVRMVGEVGLRQYLVNVLYQLKKSISGVSDEE